MHEPEVKKSKINIAHVCICYIVVMSLLHVLHRSEQTKTTEWVNSGIVVYDNIK